MEKMFARNSCSLRYARSYEESKGVAAAMIGRRGYFDRAN